MGLDITKTSSGWHAVEACEARLADLAGRRGAVLASRATVGLAAVLRSLGLPRGSGVLMPVMLCANVVHGVRGAELEPVFVDMEDASKLRITNYELRGAFGMDLGKAERAVRERGDMRVLLAVPLFGGGLDVEGLASLAEKCGLVVVEDGAQRGMRNGECGMGNRGWVTVYSFGAGKIGDAGGGAVVVGDDLELLERVRRELGGKRDLREKAGRITRSLEGLEGEVEGRRRMAEEYRERLQIAGVEHPCGEVPLWKYSVLVRDRRERDRVTVRLLERRVEATNLYVPLSRWFGGHEDGGKSEFPVAWDISERIINLPLWPVREGLLEEVLWAFGGGS